MGSTKWPLSHYSNKAHDAHHITTPPCFSHYYAKMNARSSKSSSAIEPVNGAAAKPTGEPRGVNVGERERQDRRVDRAAAAQVVGDVALRVDPVRMQMQVPRVAHIKDVLEVGAARRR